MNKIRPLEVFKWILAFVIVIAFATLGSLYNADKYTNIPVCAAILVILVLGLVGWTIIGAVMKRRFLEGLDRENLQSNLLAQRERADEIAAEKLAKLKRLIKATDLCSVAILFSVCVITFCFFALAGAEGGGAAVLLVLGAYTGLTFIRPRKIKINEAKSEDYLIEKDYPLIYETAKRAAERIGCQGRIKIFVDHDFNAGILEIDGGYSIRIGSYILDNFSRDEFFNVLLHEFAHVTEKNKDINSVMNYASLSQENGGAGGLTVLPYIYFQAKFAFEYLSYQYICSIMNEDAADRAMRDYGTPEVAASLLIKLKFSELYQWERNTYDEENIFESETLIDDPVRRPLRWFRERMEIRQDDWIRMIDSEIISRNATHPTAKMRIENLGVKKAGLVPRNDSDEYLAETGRAILHVEDMIKKQIGPHYSSIRDENYLSHKKLIDEWESAGKPVTRENYQGMIVALFSSCRISEFVELCCRVIGEIPEPANYFAHHMYGCYLLHSYDERGIDHLYKSIELNHNNWEEAMQTIGEYACVVGKQDELDKYRKRALELAKAENDVYDKMNVLNAKDKLVEERLPDGMLEDFLSYVRSIDNGSIDEIYMVRKIIDDEHFVTCVIVSPKRKADPESYSEAMENIFQYLDKSSDWQYSLFDMRLSPRGRIRRVKSSRIFKA